jgi:isopenicillin-N epimerase
MQPVVVSWGNSLSGRPRSWQDEFVWSGTRDPSPFLAVPAAIDFLANLKPVQTQDARLAGGGLPTSEYAGRRSAEAAWLRNGPTGAEGVGVFRALSGLLVDNVRRTITALTHLDPIGTGPHTWYGTMIALPLPPQVEETLQGHMHPLQAALWERFQLEVPIVNWNGRRHIRVSCHLYNDVEDIKRLEAALRELLEAQPHGVK